ncbi:hypothetical protein ACC754_41715, partial [Rhizobium johnstonii]
IKSDIAHNHACGCTKCWKPEVFVFSVVAVAPTESIEVQENGYKLAVVDSTALILTFTGLIAHLQTSVPPAKAASVARKPEST